MDDSLKTTFSLNKKLQKQIKKKITASISTEVCEV
jgi:hypothetical protein